MSTDPHNAAGLPRHEDVTFESSDVQAKTIVAYLFYLAVTVVLSFAVTIYILKFTQDMAKKAEAPPPPSRTALGRNFSSLPPEPRLQGVPGHTNDPQEDLREKIKSDTEANEKAGWVDEANGIAEIPVTDAMKIIAEKGLPAFQPTPPVKK
jgi:hypothetical protein